MGTIHRICPVGGLFFTFWGRMTQTGDVQAVDKTQSKGGAHPFFFVVFMHSFAHRISAEHNILQNYTLETTTG
jgi:hypothetical protein